MMKKLTALLLAAAVVLGTAAAELPLVYPAETVISVMRLTQAQRDLAEYLYAPVLAGETKIALPAGTRYDDVGPAMQSLMLDYPELFHLHREYTISYWQKKPEQAISVSPQYRMDARRAEELRAQLYQAAMVLVRQGGTAVGLHDALAECTAYGGDTEMRHTAVGALLQGTATCEGYAQALSLLYRMAGIPCGVVKGVGTEYMTGRQTAHAWNIMYLGGYSLIDATWNDQDGAGLNTHWYFGLSDEQMAADHTPDAEMDMPRSTDHAGWHRRYGRYAAQAEDAFRAMSDLVAYGTPVNLRVTDGALYAAIAEDIGGFMDAYNEWCPEGLAFYGRYTYMTCDAQQCLIIDRAGE